jgi:3-phosphoshikimate 1-carboxyvinyltransferase
MSRYRPNISKSWFNRIAILESFDDNLCLDRADQYDGLGEDILTLKKALSALKRGEHRFTFLDGGTSLRFFLARLSREVGEFEVKASERLWSRPHNELLSCLEKLGSKFTFDSKNGLLKLKSNGWGEGPIQLEVDCSKSSQFASALALNCLNRDWPLKLKLIHLNQARSYWEWTLELIQEYGGKVERLGIDQYHLSGQVRADEKKLFEVDWSSAASLFTYGLMRGKSFEVGPIEQKIYKQPDYKVIEFLKKNFGAHISYQNNIYRIHESDLTYDGELIDLSDNQDLFPILAVLAASLKETVLFTGLENLKYKESDRLNKVRELLSYFKVETVVEQNRVKIQGQLATAGTTVYFSPDHDHRMAFAAACIKGAGFDINIIHPEVVDKSFPDFWNIIGVAP